MSKSTPTFWRIDGLGGWMTVIKARTKREAERYARSVASSASMLPSDVGAARPATAEDIQWYESMCGMS